MKDTDYCNNIDDYYIISLVTYYNKDSNWEETENKVSCLTNEENLGDINTFLEGAAENPLDTVIYYPIFNNATILQFSKDSFDGKNSGTLGEALKKAGFNNLESSSDCPYIFKNTEQIKDSTGQQLYAEINDNSCSYNYNNESNGQNFTYAHNVFLVFHKEDYQKIILENYSKVMNGKPFYYNKDDTKVVYSSAKGIVKDLYTQVVTATEDAVKTADKFDNDLTYYDSNLNRAYTVKQYQDSAAQLGIYVLNSDTYETYIVLNSEESTSINVPIIYNHTISSDSNKVSNDGESSLELTLYNKSGKINFGSPDNDEGSSKSINATYKNNSYISIISVEYDEKEQIQNLGKLTNGEF